VQQKAGHASRTRQAEEQNLASFAAQETSPGVNGALETTVLQRLSRDPGGMTRRQIAIDIRAAELLGLQSVSNRA